MNSWGVSSGPNNNTFLYDNHTGALGMVERGRGGKLLLNFSQSDLPPFSALAIFLT